MKKHNILWQFTQQKPIKISLDAPKAEDLSVTILNSVINLQTCAALQWHYVKLHRCDFNASLSCSGKIRVRSYPHVLTQVLTGTWTAIHVRTSHAQQISSYWFWFPLKTPPQNSRRVHVFIFTTTLTGRVKAADIWNKRSHVAYKSLTRKKWPVPINWVGVYVLCVHANENSLQHNCSLSRIDSSCQMCVCEGGRGVHTWELWDCMRWLMPLLFLGC